MTESVTKWGLDEACEHPHPYEINIVFPGALGNDEAAKSLAAGFVATALELVPGLELLEIVVHDESSVVRAHVSITFELQVVSRELAASALDLLEPAAARLGGEVDCWSQLPSREPEFKPLPPMRFEVSTENGLSAEMVQDGVPMFSFFLSPEGLRRLRVIAPGLRPLVQQFPQISVLLNQLDPQDEQH